MPAIIYSLDAVFSLSHGTWYALGAVVDVGSILPHKDCVFDKDLIHSA